MVDYWRLLLTGFLLAIGHDCWLQVEIADYWRWWLIVGVYCWLLVAIADHGWWLLIVGDCWVLLAIAECWRLYYCGLLMAVAENWWFLFAIGGFLLTIGGYWWYDMGWSQIVKHQGWLITEIWRVCILLLLFFQPMRCKETPLSDILHLDWSNGFSSPWSFNAITKAATVNDHVYQPHPTSTVNCNLVVIPIIIHWCNNLL